MLTAVRALVAVLWWSAICAGVEDGPPYSKPCEENVNGFISHHPCLGSPEHVLLSDNAEFEITSSPASLTCGSNGVTIAYPMVDGVPTECTAGQHPADHIVDYTQSIGNQPNLNTFWQSVTWWDIWDKTLTPVTLNKPPQVDIVLNFDQRYQLQRDLNIYFQSVRPRKMTLYKSVDYANTWTVWQYFAQSCDDLILSGVASTSATTANPSAVICSTDFGESATDSNRVRFSVTKNRFQLFAGEDTSEYKSLYEAYDNTDLDEFLTFSDIKISLEYPATTGNEYSGLQYDLTRSWYAISNIELVTTCSCNLHAKYCIRVGDETVCDCQHNTAGKNCEICKPLYNNRPWRPGSYTPYPEGLANECHKCECNDHAVSCTYNPAFAMGVCEDCIHRTTGTKCEQCIAGYYHHPILSHKDPETCIPCSCVLLGVTDSANPVCNNVGQCNCKPLVEGSKCNECIDMYYGLTTISPFGECKACQCNSLGTQSGSNVCEKELGQCPCKQTICGRQCSECCQGYYGFPKLLSEKCKKCACDPGGSYDTPCDPVTGQCSCKPGIKGQHCNIAESGQYIPFYDSVQYQPASGTCSLSTDVITDERPFTGSGFAICNSGLSSIFDPILGGKLEQPSVSWRYDPAFRYTLNSNFAWSTATLTVRAAGNSNLKNFSKYKDTSNGALSSTCALDTGDVVIQKRIDNLPAGNGKAWISDQAIALDVRCNYQASLAMGAQGFNRNDTIRIDSFVLLPNVESSAVYTEADSIARNAYIKCQKDVANLITRDSALRTHQCKEMSLATMSEMSGQALDCNCDGVGTEPGKSCEAFGGQCPCKPGVFGRRCDSCQPGFYSFSSSGCTVCPYWPCPDYEEKDTSGEDDASISIVLIIIIVLILICMLLLILLLSKRRYRDRIFKKCTRSEGISYISLPPDGKQKTENPLYQSQENVAVIYDEELNLNLKTRVESPMSDNDLERGMSTRSNEPIIKRIPKKQSQNNEKLQKHTKTSVPSTYYDNKAYEPNVDNNEDILLNGVINNDKNKPKRKLPEPQKKEEPVVFENLPNQLPAQPRNFVQPVPPTRRPPSSSSSRQLPQTPSKASSVVSAPVGPAPPVAAVAPVSVMPGPGAPRSVDGHKRPKRTASSAHSLASVNSTASGIQGTRRKRTLPTPTPSAGGSTSTQAAVLQKANEKAAKDKANADILQQPKKEPRKRSLPDIPAAVQDDEERPRSTRKLPEPAPRQKKPKDSERVSRSVSSMDVSTTQPVSRKVSSASDGPRRTKRGLPQTPSQKPPTDPLWETDEVGGSLV